MTVLKFAEIIAKPDLPEGVFNIVTGPGGSVGEALCSHPDVDIIGFTGSSETGKEVLRYASDSSKSALWSLAATTLPSSCRTPTSAPPSQRVGSPPHGLLIDMGVNTIHFAGVMPDELFGNGRTYTSIFQQACGRVTQAVKTNL